MKLEQIPIPQSGQHVKLWAGRVRDVLRPLTNIEGDRSIGVSVGPDGVRLRFLGATRRHFEVFRLSQTSVGIRGGYATRQAAAGQHTIALGVYPGWKEGAASEAGDTSGSVDDYFTISDITADTHIVLGLDDPLVPTALTAASTGSGTYPTGDTTYLRRVLAKIVCTDGVITSIEPFVDGDWDSSFHILDSVSLNFWAPVAGANQEQVYGWNNQAADASPVQTVEVLWRASMGGAAGYSTVVNLLKPITSWSGVTIYDDVSWSGTGWPWTEIDAVSHHNLTGRNDDSDDADHAWAMCNAYGAGYDSTYVRNFCTSMGRANDKPTLVLAGQLVQDDLAQVRVDWFSQLLNDASNALSIDWGSGTGGSRSFNGGNWTFKGAGYYLAIEGTEAITPGTAASGCLRAAGGASFQGAVQADKFYILDAATLNYWDAADFLATVTNQFNVATFPAGATLRISEELIDLDAHSGGTLNLNGEHVTILASEVEWVDARIDIGGEIIDRKVLLVKA